MPDVGRLLLGIAALACALAIAAAPASSPAAAPAALPRVTLISDSVAASLSFDTGAKALLAQGVDLYLEPGQGRTLGGDVPPGSGLPVTALQLIDALGRRLGPTVIMSVGHNDPCDQYAARMEAALASLARAGVRHVLWTTFHVTDAHHGYAEMNEAIRAAAARHPEVTVVDWDAAVQAHPEWVGQDGVHLAGDGMRGMAGVLHASLVGLGIPLGGSALSR